LGLGLLTSCKTSWISTKLCKVNANGRTSFGVEVVSLVYGGILGGDNLRLMVRWWRQNPRMVGCT
jgi:hypothetical protein